jgi:hypothetical protein
VGEDVQIRHPVPYGRSVFEVDALPEPCGVCHWLSSMRGGFTSAPLVTTLTPAAPQTLARPRTAAQAGVLTPPVIPGRSPRVALS